MGGDGGHSWRGEPSGTRRGTFGDVLGDKVTEGWGIWGEDVGDGWGSTPKDVGGTSGEWGHLRRAGGYGGGIWGDN